MVGSIEGPSVPGVRTVRPLGFGVTPLDESPQDGDLERFGGETRPCPECGTEVYDEAPFCHKCGRALESQGDETPLPTWAKITAGAVLVAILLSLVLARGRIW